MKNISQVSPNNNYCGVKRNNDNNKDFSKYILQEEKNDKITIDPKKKDHAYGGMEFYNKLFTIPYKSDEEYISTKNKMDTILGNKISKIQIENNLECYKLDQVYDQERKHLYEKQEQQLACLHDPQSLTYKAIVEKYPCEWPEKLHEARVQMRENNEIERDALWAKHLQIKSQCITKTWPKIEAVFDEHYKNLEIVVDKIRLKYPTTSTGNEMENAKIENTPENDAIFSEYMQTNEIYLQKHINHEWEAICKVWTAEIEAYLAKYIPGESYEEWAQRNFGSKQLHPPH